MSTVPTFEIDITVPLPAFTVRLQWTTHSRVCGLFGPSGSGKTTLLEAVAGIRRAARGSIKVAGHCLLDSAAKIALKTENRHMGYVPQEHLLMPHLNVEANIRLGQRRALNSGRDFEKDLEQATEVLGIASLLHRTVETLSGGERQRVALARALCSGPRLLLLDEPLASLDDSLRQRILPYLVKVRDHYNLPMLIVSHNPIELQALCDEVVAIDQGRVICRGTPNTVFTRQGLYPSGNDKSFENIIPAVVLGHSAYSTRLGLSHAVPGQGLGIPRARVMAGTRVMLGLPAQEILLAVNAPTGLSARNVLSARIVNLENLDSRTIVRAELDGGPAEPIICELTREGAEALRLRGGQAVYLVIKSTAIKLYA